MFKTHPKFCLQIVFFSDFLLFEKKTTVECLSVLGIQEHVEIITQTAVITEKDQEDQEDQDSPEDLSVNEDETRPKLFGFNNFLASNCFIMYHCLKHILLAGDWPKKALHVPINVPQYTWEKIIRWWPPRLRFGSSEMEMELWSWFLFTNNNRTRRPQAMKMVGFIRIGNPPKICNFFPNVGGWYKILEVSQVVYVSDSGSGFFAACVLYIYLEPK